MKNLVNAVAQIQSQIHVVPNILQKVSREDGTVTVSVYSPGSQREADTFTFSVLFVIPEEYPESPTWLMSDNEAINDMLSAVTEEFIGGASLETLLSRVLALFGHEIEHFSNLFSYSEKALDGEAKGGEYCYIDDLEDDDYSGFDVELEDDKELMVELGRKQGRWEKFEAEFRDRTLLSDKPKPQHSSKEKLAEDRQIFDAGAAFKMLSNELLSIMKEQAFDMIVDTIDDDVYHWSVEFAGFEDNSLLADDLAKLGRTFGYCTIQLHLMFKRELHPFYPPRVELRRPRFKGPIALAISSHPMFTLRYWDPWRSQKKLLSEIKSFLQRHARVDYQSMCNSIAQYPNSAYSDAEHQLAMLEALSEVPPRWAAISEYKSLRDWCDVHVDLERIAALTGETEDSNPPPVKPAEEQKKSYWAAGTGYGHGWSGHGASREVWDAKKATTAQNAHDIEMRTVLEDLSKSLTSEIEHLSIESPHEGKSSDFKCASGLIPTLNASCLVPFITRELDNVSFTNMCERASYYLSIVKLVDQLCLPISVKVFYSATSEEKSIYQCVSKIEDQAKCYTKVINSEDCSKSYSGPSGPPLPPSLMALRGGAEKEEISGMVLAIAVTDCMDSLRHYRYLATTEELEVNEGTSSEEVESYESVMKDYQIDFSEDLAGDHVFESDSKREQASPKDRLVRLGREIAGLKSLLPLNPMSSVFVRIDEQKQTLWKALIVGPEDTPYAGGCFIFDIYFPTAYPHSSPKVLLKTTGGGTVRFNPNLYDNGTVCLSLLGTWSGAAGETWDPNASSICQVLISIQSLIFVNEPYFNEPGYEQSMHSESGRKASKDYNQNIREHTIHRAMIDHLKSPTGPFAETLLSHFKLRKDYVLDTCNKWVREAEGDEANAHKDRLKVLVSELEQLLNGTAQ